MLRGKKNSVNTCLHASVRVLRVVYLGNGATRFRLPSPHPSSHDLPPPADVEKEGTKIAEASSDSTSETSERAVRVAILDDALYPHEYSLLMFSPINNPEILLRDKSDDNVQFLLLSLHFYESDYMRSGLSVTTTATATCSKASQRAPSSTSRFLDEAASVALLDGR